MPQLRFTEEGSLTAYAGLVLIQALLGMLGLKARLRRCFAHVRKTLIYGPATVVLLLTVGILLGCRRLRDLDYCREDPLLARVDFLNITSARMARRVVHYHFALTVLP